MYSNMYYVVPIFMCDHVLHWDMFHCVLRDCRSQYSHVNHADCSYKTLGKVHMQLCTQY